MHDYKIIERGKPLSLAKKAIILLHGRGATAEDILSLADQFCDDTYYIAAPQATHYTWYPYSFLAPRNQNEPWLSSAIAIVNRLIKDTAVHVGINNIYLMGFSQGACLALEVAGRQAQSFAGVAAFTGGLIGETLDKNLYAGDFKGCQIFIGNSDNDPHVPVERSSESKSILEQLGAEVTLKVYANMPHTIVADEIETVKAMMFNK